MTLIDKAEAHDDDLIRRGDALAAIQLGDTVTKLQARIRAIPYVDADPVCTGCGGTGITYQTERRCACQGPDLSDPIAVHANMLRGTIAKPTVEQIIHLYGVDALVKALAPVIVQDADVNETPKSEHDGADVLTAAQARAPFFFDRYVNGVLMAEGVCIERETTLEGAMQAAARIAAKGPNGEAPVLVYRARAALTTEADNDRQA